MSKLQRASQATPLQLIAEPRKATSERCCEAVSGPRPEGRDMVALRWAIGLKWLPQRLLDVLHDFLRITELIEVIDEFPFAAGSDQIGESRVIHRIVIRFFCRILGNLVKRSISFRSFGDLRFGTGQS